MNNSQLSETKNFDTSRLTFNKPEERKIPGTNMSYKLIKIGVKNKDNTRGDLLFSTPRVFSFGVQDNTSPNNTNQLNGYKFPLCLFNRDGASPEERDFVTAFSDVIEECKNHLVKNKGSVGKYDLEKRDLKSLNPLYYKKENGRPLLDKGPIFYVKLMTSKNKETGGFNILSLFSNEDTGKDIDPMDLHNKQCWARACIRFENIFIGSRISIQVKLWEAVVKPKDGARKRFLPKPLFSANTTSSNTSSNTPSTTSSTTSSTNQIQDSDDSSSESDSSEVEEKKTKKTKK